MRYPYLFLVLGALFLVDLVVPDPIPLVDEILLAVLTFIAATFATRREEDPEPRDITPQEDDLRFSVRGRIRGPGTTGRIALLDQPQGRDQQLRVRRPEVCPDADSVRPAAAVKRNPDASAAPVVCSHSCLHRVIEAGGPVLRLFHHHLDAAGTGRKSVAHLEGVGPVVQDNRVSRESPNGGW